MKENSNLHERKSQNGCGICNLLPLKIELNIKRFMSYSYKYQEIAKEL